MNNKFKILLPILLALMIVAFAGCGQVEILASIDTNNLVTYTYNLNFDDVVEGDINYDELEHYLFKVGRHWKEFGFESTTDTDDDGIRMTSTIEKQCTTRQEAFDTLYGLMTNEVSPFVDVEYTYNQNFYYEDYAINANIDISGVINEDIYEVYPQVVGQDVDSFMENLKFSVIISLPYNDSTETDTVSPKETIVVISHDEPTAIAANGIINNNVNARYEQDLIAKKENEKKNMLIFSSVGLATIICLILLIVFRRKSKKKNAKTTAESETVPTTPDGTDEEK